MYDKNSRQNTIKELVRAGMVHSQEELQTLLNERGFAATQATLSRDMKALGVVKMHDSEHGYSYRIPFMNSEKQAASSQDSSANGVTSIEFTSSFAVIKTRPGYASVVAAIIDSSVQDVIMGTIAGDDTVLTILREQYSRIDVIKSLSAAVPGIENKINNI